MMDLALFFSYGMSLEDWVSSGLIDREKRIYERYLDDQVSSRVYWVTYGSRDGQLGDDLKKKGRLHAKVEILAMPAFFNIPAGKLLYSICAPWIHRKTLRKAVFLKTNQIEGSWTAVLARWISRKKLIVRCGYVWSLFSRQRNRGRKLDIFAPAAERLAFHQADHCIVTSKDARTYLKNRYSLPDNRVSVIRNYIDTDAFKPTVPFSERDDRFVFVGRLHEQKNLANLIRAMAELKKGLDIYGEGEETETLKELARSLEADIRFFGRIDNKDLPQALNRYRFFILASTYEGLPKSLLEAMACGLVCFGTDVAGTREVIKDGTNGFLIRGTSSSDIAAGIRTTADRDTESIRQDAVRMIREEYALDVVYHQERKVLQSLM